MASDLSVGDRVHTRGQQYAEASYWGTGTVIESIVDGQQFYRVLHDPGTRVFTDDAYVDLWHHTHLRKSDFQFNVVEYDHVPYVTRERAKSLEVIGFKRGIHFKLWADDFPESSQ